jgi:hypothetical protein
MVEVRLEVLVETLATLLGRASANGRRNADPVVGTVKVDQVKQVLVLGGGPGSSLVLRHDC